MISRSSKGMSEEAFNAQLRAERVGLKGSHGMVMTKPPTGPSKSLEEMLRDQTVAADTVQSVPSSKPAAPATVPVTPRTLLQISVQAIDPNPLAPREVYLPSMIQDRAEALRTQGQHDPIHVIPHPEQADRYIICDGWTRVLACIEHKVLDYLMAEVHQDLTIEQAAWFGYQQNEERQQHCDLDRAKFYEKLIENGQTPADVARRAKISRTQMSFYRAYARLPDDVTDIIRGNPQKFGASAAYQLYKVAEKSVRHAVKLAVKFSEEDHPYSWLVNQAQLLLNPSDHKSPPASKQVRYHNGYYKQRGEVFEVSIAVSADKRAEFANALEALLATVAIEAQLELQQADDEV